MVAKINTCSSISAGVLISDYSYRRGGGTFLISDYSYSRGGGTEFITEYSRSRGSGTVNLSTV